MSSEAAQKAYPEDEVEIPAIRESYRAGTWEYEFLMGRDSWEAGQ